MGHEQTSYWESWSPLEKRAWWKLSKVIANNIEMRYSLGSQSRHEKVMLVIEVSATLVCPILKHHWLNHSGYQGNYLPNNMSRNWKQNSANTAIEIVCLFLCRVALDNVFHKLHMYLKFQPSIYIYICIHPNIYPHMHLHMYMHVTYIYGETSVTHACT